MELTYITGKPVYKVILRTKGNLALWSQTKDSANQNTGFYVPSTNFALRKDL